MKLEITGYEKEQEYYMFNHSATVRLVDKPEKPLSVEELAALTSIEVGYHPAGYGLYDWGAEEIGEDLYKIGWTTGTHCD